MASLKSPSGETARDWYEEVLVYLRSNSHRKVSVVEAAAVAGRSASALQRRMLREMGKGFAAFLLALRVEAAKRMLAQTKRPIAEVAVDCGFGTPSHFTHLFHREVGMAPREYRDRNRASPPPGAEAVSLRGGEPFFREPCSPASLVRSWDIRTGSWRASGGAFHGTAAEDLGLRLRDRLPADFLLRLDIKRAPRSSSGSPGAVTIAFCGDAGWTTTGCSVVLGSPRTGSHRIDWGTTRMDETGGDLAPATWHAVAISFHRGHVAVELDGRSILRCAYLLPLPHRERCRLVIAGWNASLTLRRIALHSLISLDHPDPVAVADAFATEGRHERALALYEEELAKARGTYREEDLLFKTGMCYANLGLRIRARGYLERFSALRPGTVWGMAAALSALEGRIDDLAAEALREEATRILDGARSAAQRELVLETLGRAAERCRNEGDYERAIALAELVLDAGEPASPQARLAARRLVDSLFADYRYEDIISFVSSAPARDKLEEGERTRILPTVALAHAARGRMTQAYKALRPAASSNDVHPRASASLTEGLLLQTEGNLAKAVSKFLSIPAEFSVATEACATALESAALLRGPVETDPPEKVWRRVCDGAGAGAAYDLPRHVRRALDAAAGRYATVVPALAEEVYARKETDRRAIADSLLLCVLYELSGDVARARRNLEVLDRAFRDGPLRRWALPASYLLGTATAEALWVTTRGMGLFYDLSASSTFYMLGLVERSRGRRGHSAGLFRLAVKADPFNHWPAVLARRELGRLTPAMRRFLSADYSRSTRRRETGPATPA